MTNRRVAELENENAHLRSLLDSFFTGDVPKGACLEHIILAKWGRKRLEQNAKKPSLLQNAE